MLLPFHPWYEFQDQYDISSYWFQYDDGNLFDQHEQQWTGHDWDAMLQYKQPYEDPYEFYGAISLYANEM